MDIQTLLIIFLIVVVMVAAIAIKVRALEVKVSNMPEYKNIEEMRKDMYQIDSKLSKIEGSLRGLNGLITKVNMIDQHLMNKSK